MADAPYHLSWWPGCVLSSDSRPEDRMAVGKRKAQPDLPLVRVVIKEEEVAPRQMMAWRRLWSLLTAPETTSPGQAPNKPTRGDGAEGDDEQPQHQHNIPP